SGQVCCNAGWCSFQSAAPIARASLIAAIHPRWQSLASRTRTLPAMHWQVHVCAWRYSLLLLGIEAVAIVGTAAPANRRLFSETMATTQICTGIQAFARRIFVARRARVGVSLLKMKASPLGCLVNIALIRRFPTADSAPSTHANVKLLINSLAADVRSSEVPLRSARA